MTVDATITSAGRLDALRVVHAAGGSRKPITRHFSKRTRERTVLLVAAIEAILVPVANLAQRDAALLEQGVASDRTLEFVVLAMNFAAFLVRTIFTVLVRVAFLIQVVAISDRWPPPQHPRPTGLFALGAFVFAVHFVRVVRAVLLPVASIVRWHASTSPGAYVEAILAEELTRSAERRTVQLIGSVFAVVDSVADFCRIDAEATLERIVLRYKMSFMAEELVNGTQILAVLLVSTVDAVLSSVTALAYRHAEFFGVSYRPVDAMVLVFGADTATTELVRAIGAFLVPVTNLELGQTEAEEGPPGDQAAGTSELTGRTCVVTVHLVAAVNAIVHSVANVAKQDTRMHSAHRRAVVALEFADRTTFGTVCLVRAIVTVVIAIAFLVSSDTVAVVGKSGDRIPRAHEVALGTLVRTVPLIAGVSAVGLPIAEEAHRQAEVAPTSISAVHAAEFVRFAVAVQLVRVVGTVGKPVAFLAWIRTLDAQKAIDGVFALAPKSSIRTAGAVEFVDARHTVDVPVADFVTRYTVVA